MMPPKKAARKNAPRKTNPAKERTARSARKGKPAAAPNSAKPPHQPQAPRLALVIFGVAYWLEFTPFLPTLDLAFQTLSREALREFLLRYGVKVVAWTSATGFEQVVLTSDKGDVLGNWLD